MIGTDKDLVSPIQTGNNTLVSSMITVTLFQEGHEKTTQNSDSSKSYGLRPRKRLRHLESEDWPASVPHLPPHKKSRRRLRNKQHLSKYRRKTANARERHRMKTINDAFVALRGVLPAFTRTSQCEPAAALAVMTKFATIKLAVNYIRALATILQEDKPTGIERNWELKQENYAYITIPSNYQVIDMPNEGKLCGSFDLDNLVNIDIIRDCYLASDDIRIISEYDSIGNIMPSEMDILVASTS